MSALTHLRTPSCTSRFLVRVDLASCNPGTENKNGEAKPPKSFQSVTMLSSDPNTDLRMISGLSSYSMTSQSMS